MFMQFYYICFSLGISSHFQALVCFGYCLAISQQADTSLYHNMKDHICCFSVYIVFTLIYISAKAWYLGVFAM